MLTKNAVQSKEEQEEVAKHLHVSEWSCIADCTTRVRILKCCNNVDRFRDRGRDARPWHARDIHITGGTQIGSGIIFAQFPAGHQP